MSLGKRIAAARQAKQMSQAMLAEIMEVSPEAVSKWEQDSYRPNRERLRRLEEILELSFSDNSQQSARLFREEQMSAFLKGRLSASGLLESLYALSYAKEKHAGSYRKPEVLKIPYIIHPLTMACHALALGLNDDALISALLLHDVAEDCGIDAKELPFSSEICELVDLVTKPEKLYNENDYYDAIAKNPRACLIKCIDRCNNLSTMSIGFSSKKIAEYVRETERYYQKLLRVVKSCPQYSDAAWLLKYQIWSLMETAKRIP